MIIGILKEDRWGRKLIIIERKVIETCVGYKRMCDGCFLQVLFQTNFSRENLASFLEETL